MKTKDVHAQVLISDDNTGIQVTIESPTVETDFELKRLLAICAFGLLEQGGMSKKEIINLIHDNRAAEEDMN